MNTYFTDEKNRTQLNALLIVGSLIMDITVPTLLIFFLLRGKETWRIPLEFSILYILRLFCLNVFAMEIPDGYFWESPGLLSLTVPYGWTNDFFFSGHVASSTFALLEYRLATKTYAGN